MKYINIIDLKDFECYTNVNCRLLYLELCSLMDVKTRNVTISQRRLERSLPMTYSAIRHALTMLMRDGLVAQISAQEEAQGATRQTTQRATHLHIMSYNELSDTNSATSNATSNAQSNAPSDATNDADFKQEIENNNNKNLQITHTRASEVLDKLRDSDAALYIDVSAHRIKGFKREFLARMRVKARVWKDENDLIAHFLDWANKNKKSILNKLQDLDRDEQAYREREAERIELMTEQPHPKSLSLAEWQYIERQVKKKQAAPSLIEMYQRGLAEMEADSK